MPPAVVREGKVPAAWFLEQIGAKGMAEGGIHVADYHANLIYNDGAGTARELRALIGELKARVRARFGLRSKKKCSTSDSRERPVERKAEKPIDLHGIIVISF